MQDRKDVERDSLIVNGCFVKGSDGYDTVVAAVTDALLEEDAALGTDTANEMATQVLHYAAGIGARFATLAFIINF